MAGLLLTSSPPWAVVWQVDPQEAPRVQVAHGRQHRVRPPHRAPREYSTYDPPPPPWLWPGCDSCRLRGRQAGTAPSYPFLSTGPAPHLSVILNGSMPSTPFSAWLCGCMQVGNVLTTVGGPMLLGSHVLVFWAYFAFRLCETFDAHRCVRAYR